MTDDDKALYPTLPTDYDRFIISEPKPDPLVDVFCRGLWSEAGLSISTKEIRAALEARGLEIRKKNDAHQPHNANVGRQRTAATQRDCA